MIKNAKGIRPSHQLWAEFRFGVVGPLLSNPPGPGELHLRLKTLADIEWRHPFEDRKFKLSFPTLERWYYKSLNQDKDPVGVLRRKLRADSGATKSLTLEMKDLIQKNYKLHPSWSVQLHFDNLKSWLQQKSKNDQNHCQHYEKIPSYGTIIRYIRIEGLYKKARVRSPFAPGRAAAEARLNEREVRSYEVEYVGGLFHLDFHHASRPIRTEKGELITPLALCIIDDHSRLVCHLQWYWWEDTRSLVHGFVQALQKRGLPRSLMSDNGSAMTSAEFTQGLSRLGINHETTLPYSPYQNAKQESFWGTLEGRMMAMLEGNKNLSLGDLNKISQAWVEIEYNRAVHSETNQSPIERFLNGKSILRNIPKDRDIKLCFRRDETRSQRRSDGTISIEGKRFEIPSAYRSIDRLHIRFASWDLRYINIIDPKSQTILAAIYPLDRLKNAEGLRKRMSTNQNGNMIATEKNDEENIPPLLEDIIAQYAATGLPSAYVVDSRKHGKVGEEIEL